MKSLGVIETRGWVAAIQAVDAACKAAGVTCIGYRKVGSGLVSVCFEGEISAIHTAIERGVAVVKAINLPANSLVIARPERCIVEALSTLKGHPPRVKAEPAAPVEPAHDVPAELAAPQETAVEEKNAAHKKGKKA
ncbi:BMC domain-containing protein [Kluyvera ascorbata]|uniref:BMC domain-containing protein n=1 Tax=Kluyvera ascorbata TaxID=51288 RepID=UPI00330A0B41|nr:BMC domain-containing protein [Kluyvera ascorbata]HDG1694479.1 BMC domain-containing protein [Kluyvera ascorbata]